MDFSGTKTQRPDVWFLQYRATAHTVERSMEALIVSRTFNFIMRRDWMACTHAPPTHTHTHIFSLELLES